MENKFIKIIFIIVLTLDDSNYNLIAQSQYPLLKLSRADDDRTNGQGGLKNSNCESRKTIEEVRKTFTGCTFDNDFYMYPVLVENFDYKEDLPNNWNFNLKWSLNEVEIYIQKNKHLPGIESEEIILNNGYDINEMDAKLLEKIENLYLYIIEQQKEINALKKQLNK